MKTTNRMTWNGARAFVLREARAARGWSQNDLAKAASVSQRAVRAAEAGASEVGCAFFAAVCAALEVHPEAFAV